MAMSKPTKVAKAKPSKPTKVAKAKPAKVPKAKAKPVRKVPFFHLTGNMHVRWEMKALCSRL